MSEFPTYQIGTVSVANGGTIVTGDDVLWSGVNARSGDEISIDGLPFVKIADVTDFNHLTLMLPWSGGDKTDVDYIISMESPNRYVGAESAGDVQRLISVLNSKGLLWYLDPFWSEPSEARPYLTADEGQAILKIATGELWVMQGGSWVPAGTFKGFSFKGAYDSGATYVANDVVTSAGSAYIVTAAPPVGTAPPNASYYALLASKGDIGATGATGPAPLKPIAAWATGVNFVVGPPASFVSHSGAAYQCLIPHTSGTFNTDLAAGKWGLVAAKGTDGAGTGDVVGPSSATDTEIAVFDGTTGKLLKDGASHPYSATGKYLTTGADVDSIQKNGRYACDPGVAHLPTANWYVVDHFVQGNSPGQHATQIAYLLGSNSVFIRNLASYVWSAWVQVPAPTATGASLMSAADAAAARNAISAFGKVVVQKFTTGGTYTPSSNLIYATIECVGGGGGGGGVTSSSPVSTAGGGGGGGAYSRLIATAATIGASQTVTIGAGGTGGSTSGGTGGAGGDTSVGTICVAKGGSGGGGGNGGFGNSGGAGGAGASGTGDIKVDGNGGGTGVASTQASVQVGGGGAGGGSYFGGGAKGLTFSGGGAAASSNSGGGGGGATIVGSGSNTGGAGGSGLVVITEYCSG